MCKSGESMIDENGVCINFCSKYGFCGNTKDYKTNGYDCRSCGGTLSFIVILFGRDKNNVPI